MSRQPTGGEPSPDRLRDPSPQAEAEDLPSREEMGTFFAFRYPAFRWLWVGNAFSSAAQWMHLTTLSWVVYDITESAVLLGAIIGVGNLVSPLTSPFAGLAADRFKRNHLVAASQVLLLLNALLLGLALRVDVVHVWMLFAFSIGASILNGINMPARQALVFDIVPRAVGANGVALSNIAMNVMRTVGPSAGGLVIVLFGAANSFFVQSVVYALVMVTVLRIRVPDRPVGANVGRSFQRDLVEGYRWVIGSAQARVLLILVIIYPLFIIPVHTTLVVVFAEDVFEGGAGGLGILLSALGAGGIVGGFAVAGMNRVERRGHVLLYAMLACGGFLALFALLGGITGGFWIGVLMLVFSGVGGAMFNTTNQTLIQLVAPDHLRGRVTAVLQIQPLCMAVGIFVTGVAADAFGAIPAGTGNGVLAVAAVIAVFALSSHMRNLNMSRLVDRQE